MAWQPKGHRRIGCPENCWESMIAILPSWGSGCLWMQTSGVLCYHNFADSICSTFFDLYTRNEDSVLPRLPYVAYRVDFWPLRPINRTYLGATCCIPESSLSLMHGFPAACVGAAPVCDGDATVSSWVGVNDRRIYTSMLDDCNHVW